MTGASVAVVGATGALGGCVVSALEALGVVDELVPLATDRSLGREVDFRGAAVAVETERARLRGADLVLLCAPPGASLAWLADALRMRVPAVDCSGALALRPEVPLALDAWSADAEGGPAPVVALPSGVALAWLRVLAPLHAAFGLRRVVGSVVACAGASGLAGMATLQAETVALLGQGEAPESALDHPLAFDVLPWAGELDEEGASGVETELAAQVRRGLDAEIGVAVSVVRVPTFCGDAASLAIESTARPSADAVREVLRKAAGLELVDEAHGPTTRAAAGRDCVLVGRVRSDPSQPEGTLLWLAADSPCLAAAHAARLVEARLGARAT
jgi:aspartate-semialdehyde dehydrogenase